MACLSDLRLLYRVAALPSGWRWLGLFAWMVVVGVNAQPHGGRLEPAERARLRHELREQAWGHRHAERGAQHAARHAAWHEAAGMAARPVGALSPAGPGTEFAPRLAPIADGTSPPAAVAADPAGERSPHRLSPDERRHLRSQLHEERRRRREQGELPQR